MSVTTVSQSLSAVSNGVIQPTLSFSGHLCALFQFRRLAIPTLVISTVAGAVLGVFVASKAMDVFDNVALRVRLWRLTHPFHKISTVVIGITAGVLTLAGVNIGVSKLFKLPFSRRSSVGITVATIVLPILAGFGFVLVFAILKKRKIQSMQEQAKFKQEEDNHLKTVEK